MDWMSGAANGMLVACLLGFAATGMNAQAPTYDEAIGVKTKLLESAAQRAIAQQRTTHLDPFLLAATWEGVGKVKVEECADWDVDGDGKCYRITVTDISGAQRDKGVPDKIRITFPEPVDFLAKGTGLGFWIKADDSLSPDLRFGVYFKGNVPDPIVFTDIPVRHKFGDNPHQAYIDWGHAFDHSCGVFKTPPNSFWSAVTGLEIPIVHKRLPGDGKKLEPASGVFYVDGLSLLDIYDGSYDSDRFAGGGINTGKNNLVAQGRFNQVARICAGFDGEAGRASAVRALDHMVRLQSWDGSWPEGPTRLQGAETHGMIVADLAYALKHLREAKDPALKEKVRIRHFDDLRENIYETVVWRGAMSRAPGPMSQWRDSYFRGEGSLTAGCNRPMVLFAAQHIAAQQTRDPERKRQLLAEYDLNMNELLTYQGKTAGGWPIFGEGNAYQGKGLHFDLGYTMDHVYIMAFASRATGDERWGKMIKKFDTVVKAMILKDGVLFDGPWHERHGQGPGKPGKMKVADLVFQEGLRWDAPHYAQWGYNTHKEYWKKFPTGLWQYVGTARGYGLGAFLTWNCYDLELEPRPRDLGVVFPRQWPVWTATWNHKDGRQGVRKTLATIAPDGAIDIPMKWELGEYPVITGLPLQFVAQGGAVRIEALEYSGLVSKLDPAAAAKVTQDGAPVAAQDTGGYQIKVDKATKMTLTQGEVKIVFQAEPANPDAPATLTFQLIPRP